MDARLTPETAARFARIALGHVGREYPNRLDQVLHSRSDLRTPRELHPAFFGSFDWHSCVEGYWMLARIARRFPALEGAAAIRAAFAEHVTEANLAAEAAYAGAPGNAGFERPYGWAWLLMLAAELSHDGFDGAAQIGCALAPLERVIVERFLAYLPKATYPVRAGTHGNTAFACTLAHAYAVVCGRADLRAAIENSTRRWYAADKDAQVWEPSGNDFLSPALCEAVCMQRILAAADFTRWFAAFAPQLSRREPRTLFTPATVSDRTDGQIAHLDGLNLSRAWCWRRLASAAPDAATAADMHDAATRHLGAALPHLADDYMGEHWLAVYAVLALDSEEPE